MLCCVYYDSLPCVFLFGTGIYEFTFEDGSKTRGRYSFVYAYENGEWKIANHHSSIMPEPAVAAFKKVAVLEKSVTDLQKPVSNENLELKALPVSNEIVELKAVPVSNDMVELKAVPVSNENIELKAVPVSNENIELKAVPVSNDMVELKALPVSNKNVEVNKVAEQVELDKGVEA